MRTLIHHRLWSLLFGSGLACGGATNPLFDDTSSDARDVQGFVGDEADPGGSSALKAGTVTALFPGAGTSGAARALSPGLGPETSGDCDPQPAASEPVTGTGVQTVCFFGEDDTTPAAAIEQIVEIVGNDEWVHIRLTLNPDLVDNTYGETAVGWEARAGGPGAGPGAEPKPPKEPREPRAPRAGEAEPPEPPEGAAPPEPPAPPEGAAPPEPPAGGPPPEPPAGAAPPERREPPPDREPRPAPGARAGHTFRDLVGSDHTEMVLLDANGVPALHFRLDYLSAAAELPSGYASLGVVGGEGRMQLGEQSSIFASTTSLDRNLNACGLSAFVENSPATDSEYTPNPEASAWDYRVSYDVWVSLEAFGEAGFGSALIENVHASPSKLGKNTLEVQPAPCPVDPEAPGAEPEPLPDALTIIR